MTVMIRGLRLGGWVGMGMKLRFEVVFGHMLQTFVAAAPLRLKG